MEVKPWQKRVQRVCGHLSSSFNVLEMKSSSKKFENPYLKISEEVLNALKNGKPVVALESTIISHGMPYPQNVETARRVEQMVRSNGAVPATIAILKGEILVGLTENQLETLGVLGEKCHKCSRRDLAMVVAKKENGATTVAATMYIASLAGIPVFVTGGIGGVHRGVSETMDISADLTELGRTRVAVVCAGVKSILDIPRTLEFLETQGVPVIAYKTDEFPAFFTRKSGCRAPLKVNSVGEVAQFLFATEKLELNTGAVIAVPIPENQEGDGKEIEKATQKALQEVVDKKIQGRDITPYLLDRINQLTKGRSLKSNIGLVLNNAKIGSQIAVLLAKRKRLN
mmetsp:Transcript_10457/g.15591  ORF Transcript_10457/g.15591 Transcript_10457/m.15591 type:complete len:342 (+) Transcript_10457:325-1350(+)|eukprot:CAMPEP_0167740600 /NCGR_PEP_ID=MMETSP0110_2-20121227/372_1 /TAXON_ID=629695 /ORGANISM="Gymnochlora sp., Strain CCMP2014" /LENGTH=341 /DNA_ID=CAMNT_0007624521 /DNA_START=383 /DNA_END=1408 /DNA_ORIENTATION=+